jgi:hypothetical protein
MEVLTNVKEPGSSARKDSNATIKRCLTAFQRPVIRLPATVFLRAAIANTSCLLAL